MITKQSVMCGFLLLSAVAPVEAMNLEASENAAGEMQLSSVASEVSTPEAVENAEMDLSPMATEPAGSEAELMASDYSDMSSEQPTSMKKKMAPASEMTEEMAMDREMTSVAPEATADMPTSEMTTSEMSEPAMEDKNDDQEHADVQGVFESMSREEEDESFPG